VQYSDQAEAERASVLEKFHQATLQWNQTAKVSDVAESMSLKLSIVVATDACLPLAAMAEAPLTARILINYELPTKKVSVAHTCGYVLCFFNFRPKAKF
jgi:translation initiation factor 4A